MTIKEIIQEVANVESFKEKYNLSNTDIDLVLKTAGSRGKPILQQTFHNVARIATRHPHG